LNTAGPRVDSEETGGLFSKSDSADRYAVCLTRLGSVLGRRIKIKRLWQVGRAGRRRDSLATCSRGGGSPDLAKPGRPGVKSSGLWPGMEYAACAIHLGLVCGAGRPVAACVALVAGLRGGARRCEAFRGFQGLRPIQTSAKATEGCLGMLNEARGGRGCSAGSRRRGPAASHGRRSGRTYCRASPGYWTEQLDPRRSCGGPTGIREVQGSPAVRDRDGGSTYPRRRWAEFPSERGAKEGEDGR